MSKRSEAAAKAWREWRMKLNAHNVAADFPPDDRWYVQRVPEKDRRANLVPVMEGGFPRMRWEFDKAWNAIPPLDRTGEPVKEGASFDTQQEAMNYAIRRA